MKLSARDAKAFFTKPDADRPALLIYGPDSMRIALKRKDTITALIGPEGEDEMRLTRMSGAELRKDQAALQDAIKAVGFFPGPRAVLVEEAGDGVAQILSDALDVWTKGDAMIVTTAGQLPPKSKLRKLFEGHASAVVAAIYDDPMGRDEIETELRRAGMGDISREAMGELETLARGLEPGDFRQTLEKIALYKIGDPDPLTADDVLLLAPATYDAEADDLCHAVAEGRVGDVAPLMQRLSGQGVTPVTLILSVSRHIRTLHAAACDPGGAAQGIIKVRPPVLWKYRDRMGRQASQWGRDRLEQGLTALLDLDLALRSGGQTAPPAALVERLFVRLATLGRSR